MTVHRVISALAVACVAFVLSGCFVVASNVPSGKRVDDDRLVGAWQGYDKDDKKPADAFLHVQKNEEDKNLRLIWVEDKGYQVYAVTTLRIGDKNVFAAEIVEPKQKAKDDDIPLGYHIGFYEMNSKGDELTFWLLDAEKVGEMIAKGKVKGKKPGSKYDFATLTGSPDELAKFLASRDADAARIKDPAVIRRISTGKSW